MTENPDFSAQTAEPLTADERRQWFQSRAKEFRDKGAVEVRVSIDDTHSPMISLTEGWLTKPKNPPPPHFHMTHATNPGG